MTMETFAEFAKTMAVVLSLWAFAATAAVADDKPKRVLRHVVLFNFKDELNRQQVQEVVDAFKALPKKIDQIHDFEHGVDVSVENKSKGFTHGFVVTFLSEKDRDEYLPHEAHQEFVKLVGPRLEDVLVFDYWTGP